jgi:S1-C subfamily serine protease
VTRGVRSALAAVLLAVALSPGSAAAARKSAVERFYAEAARAVATVEYTQEYLAGGQRQQARAHTDGVVVSPEGLVLVSGIVRFPQRSGGGGRIASGSLPELSAFRLIFADGRRYAAEVVAFEDDLNLGLLRITDAGPDPKLPHVEFAGNFDARVGAGLRSMTLYSEEYGRTPIYAEMGINAMLSTPQEVWSLAGVSSGLVGAPLWDGKGRAVGIVAQVPMSPWAGRQVVPELSGPVGLSYGRFRGFLDNASELEKLRQAAMASQADEDAAWMGVMFAPLEPELAEHLRISKGGGVVVTRVVPTSPAEAAGIRPLDVLVEMDGERIAVTQDSDTPVFARRIRSYEPGTKVSVTREQPGGARETLAMTLVKSPRSELHAARRSDDAFDLSVREITLDTLLGQRLEPGTQGVVVDGVTQAGWAGLAGLSVGLIIQRINEFDVTDLDTFSAALAAIREEEPEKVLFFVRHGRTTRFHVAEPDWNEMVNPLPRPSAAPTGEGAGPP